MQEKAEKKRKEKFVKSNEKKSKIFYILKKKLTMSD